MKPSRLTEEQIIGLLREQKVGAATSDVCRRHGVGSATFYKLKAKTKTHFVWMSETGSHGSALTPPFVGLTSHSEMPNMLP